MSKTVVLCLLAQSLVEKINETLQSDQRILDHLYSFYCGPFHGRDVRTLVRHVSIAIILEVAQIIICIVAFILTSEDFKKISACYGIERAFSIAL